ncbi:MAG: DUF1707 and DUF4870 domain-containing protein [Streptosporangiales bacterium]|nr:DUF1707 and DUF4870 domain-containing protein [Streptosporangiales bacterium]MBO0890975.1 DUF1707 and DUF4870 domain-containing protein [Acidothermales bacterium]
MNHAAAPHPFRPQPWLRVANSDRDKVVEILHEAYAEGRLDDAELDARIDRVLAARTYGELEAPLVDLLPSAPPRPAGPPPQPLSTSSGERTAALLMHWSAFPTFFLVPLIIYLAEGRRNSYLRAQAAEATNFQLTFLIANIALGATAFLILPALLFPVIWVAWLLLVFVGGLSAATGSRFRYPLTVRFVR